MPFFYVSKLKTLQITHNPYNAKMSSQVHGHKYQKLATIDKKSAKSAKNDQNWDFPQILTKKFFFANFLRNPIKIP